MELETAVSYLVALAVPLWLVVEFAVRSWKPSNRRQGRRVSTQPQAARGSRAPTGSLADSRKPA